MRKKIAQTLKQIRNERHYSTNYVSNALKESGISISPNTLYNYENGISQPNADMFLQLCKIYGITDFRLFFDEDIQIKEKSLYDSLNQSGKMKADEYIEDLLKIPQYTDKSESESSLTVTNASISNDIISELNQDVPIPTNSN